MALTARRRLVHASGPQSGPGALDQFADHDGLLRAADAVVSATAATTTTLKRASISAVNFIIARKGGSRKRRTAAFASISMADTSSVHVSKGNVQQRSQQQSQRKPPRQVLFTIASAGSEVRIPEGVPAWRVIIGNLAAGATAGCSVEAALYPIDTIKTRLQLVRTGGGFRALMQAGGGKALYAGIWGNLLGVAPSTGVFMAIYEPLKQAVAARVPQDRSFLAPMVAGAGSGLVASLIRVPTEVVKQRMQSGEFVGLLNAVKSIFAKEGLRGMYAGYGSFLLRDLPFDAIEFLAYEQLRKAYKTVLKDERSINGGETAVIGALAGAITGVATTPLDVVKTRLMTQGTNKVYSGVIDCVRKIWQEEGSAAFLRGWEPRVIWIGLGGCVFFTVLEEAKKFYAPRGTGKV